MYGYFELNKHLTATLCVDEILFIFEVFGRLQLHHKISTTIQRVLLIKFLHLLGTLQTVCKPFVLHQPKLSKSSELDGSKARV